MCAYFVNFVIKCLLVYVVGLRIKETKEVYEGEVIELTPVETENPMGGKCELPVVTICLSIYHEEYSGILHGCMCEINFVPPLLIL